MPSYILHRTMGNKVIILLDANNRKPYSDRLNNKENVSIHTARHSEIGRFLSQ